MTTRDDWNKEDAVIRDAFAGLRGAVELATPAFDDVLARRTAGHHVSFRVAPLAIAAGLVLAVAGAYTLAANRHERLVVPTEVIALSAWRPATDVLLDTPGRDLLRHPPSLGTSLITITGDYR